MAEHISPFPTHVHKHKKRLFHQYLFWLFRCYIFVCAYFIFFNVIRINNNSYYRDLSFVNRLLRIRTWRLLRWLNMKFYNILLHNKKEIYDLVIPVWKNKPKISWSLFSILLRVVLRSSISIVFSYNKLNKVQYCQNVFDMFRFDIQYFGTQLAINNERNKWRFTMQVAYKTIKHMLDVAIS